MTRHTLLLLPVLLAGCAPARPPAPAPPAAGQDWVEATLARLPLERKVAQMVVGWMGGEYLPHDSDAYDRLRDLVVGRGVGGMLVSIGPPLEVAARLNALQRLADVPLLIAADLERGAGMRLTGGVIPPALQLGGATEFPPALAFGAAGDDGLVRAAARITAVEARAVGIHVNFAPVVDVNSNPANPIINTRSFGEDPAAVGRLAAAYVEGLRAGGMLAVAKHFPGHGDAATDSHLELPIIAADLDRLRSVELVPFRAAVDAGVDGIMSAHIALPRVSGDSVPATLSPRLLRGLLDSELDFRGLVIADQLNMGALVRRYGPAEIPVLAVEAGADVLLIPPDIGVAIDAVVAAVRSGRLAEARIDASVRRILAAKARLALHVERTVALERVPELVGGREGERLAQRVAERALTLVRDRARLVPLPAGRTLLVIYSEEPDAALGRVLERELARARELTVRRIAGSDAALTSLAADAAAYDAVVLAAFVRVVSWRGSVALPEAAARAFGEVAARRPAVLVSFGSPYLLTQAPGIGSYLLAWGFDDASQRAAARALRGELVPPGRLPISIPPHHALGEGARAGGGP
jgi:beta-N-acetylhexosaminidase